MGQNGTVAMVTSKLLGAYLFVGDKLSNKGIPKPWCKTKGACVKDGKRWNGMHWMYCTEESKQFLNDFS